MMDSTESEETVFAAESLSSAIAVNVDDSSTRTEIVATEPEPEHTWTGPFSFVLGADPQFGMIGTCKLKKTTPTWQPEMTLCREAIQKINAMNPKPKFFLVCGDMLDALPFDKNDIVHYNNNDNVIRDQQYADFMKLFREELDPEIKLVFVSGNHDVGDVPTPDTLSKYREEFGPDYYTFWVGGVKFVVLNSQFFYAPDAVPEETQKHEQWIEENVPDDKAKFIVVFQHIPFFRDDPEEETIFSNIPTERRLVLLEKLWKAGVRHVFCGHLHRNAGGKYKDMEQVVTSAMGAPFGDDPSGFRVINVGEFDITHEYVQLRETTDCTEFGDEVQNKEETKSISASEKTEFNDVARNKEETKSISASEKIRRTRWLLACCGANTALEEENDNVEEESVSL